VSGPFCDTWFLIGTTFGFVLGLLTMLFAKAIDKRAERERRTKGQT
jgi:hypothetical protein